MCPVVLTRGTDQAPVSTRFEQRGDPSVMRNYGRMLVDLAAAIPDGIICFFVSYSYMDLIISKWHDMGILQVLLLQLPSPTLVQGSARLCALPSAVHVMYELRACEHFSAPDSKKARRAEQV